MTALEAVTVREGKVTEMPQGMNLKLEDREAEGGNLEFMLSFDGWTPGGLTSDLVHDGLYEALIVSCKPKKNKRGDGLNAVTVLKIAGPSCPDKGKQLVAYHPVPVGDLNSPDNLKKRFLNNLFASIVSGKKGTEGAEALKGAGLRKFTFATFEGRTCYIKVRETTDNNARPVGEIQFYIFREQYEANPGPFGAVPEADLSKSAAAAIDNPAGGTTTAAAAAPAKTEAAPAAAPAAATTAAANALDGLLDT